MVTLSIFIIIITGSCKVLTRLGISEYLKLTQIKERPMRSQHYFMSWRNTQETQLAECSWIIYNRKPSRFIRAGFQLLAAHRVNWRLSPAVLWDTSWQDGVLIFPGYARKWLGRSSWTGSIRKQPRSWLLHLAAVQEHTCQGGITPSWAAVCQCIIL